MWSIFLFVKCKFLFFKVTSGQLIIACLINLDMINISKESFKLLLNEIKHIENKTSFIIIIIRTDAFIKGASNEEMGSATSSLRHRLRKH